MDSVNAVNRIPFSSIVVQGVGLGPTNFQIISLGPYQLGHPCVNKAHNITALYRLSYTTRKWRQDSNLRHPAPQAIM